MFKNLEKKSKSFIFNKKSNDLARFKSHMNTSTPIVVLGNQKTGSTVIASLLSKATNQPVTLDLQKARQDIGWQLCVKHHVVSFENFAYKHKIEFMKPIIKEPSLTFFYDELAHLMPHARYVFIQRNPLHNIRSILNRLQIPGDRETLNYEEWPEICRRPIWRLVLDSTWLGRPNSHYIEGLAHRWDVATQIYLNHQDNFTLIRYEDFLQNKKASIEQLCSDLDLAVKNDISPYVDIQHQRKGDTSVSLEDFFGERNFQCIKHICSQNAARMGYSLDASDSFTQSNRVAASSV